jgi:hypothetical protein
MVRLAGFSPVGKWTESAFSRFKQVMIGSPKAVKTAGKTSFPFGTPG